MDINLVVGSNARRESSARFTGTLLPLQGAFKIRATGASPRSRKSFSGRVVSASLQLREHLRQCGPECSRLPAGLGNGGRPFQPLI
jgi:hypothetical protein